LISKSTKTASVALRRCSGHVVHLVVPGDVFSEIVLIVTIVASILVDKVPVPAVCFKLGPHSVLARLDGFVPVRVIGDHWGEFVQLQVPGDHVAFRSSANCVVPSRVHSRVVDVVHVPAFSGVLDEEVEVINHVLVALFVHTLGLSGKFLSGVGLVAHDVPHNTPFVICGPEVIPSLLVHKIFIVPVRFRI